MNGERGGPVRVITGLWRWRHNPLRRTTDLVEAWTALATVLVMVFGAPAVGWAVGTATQHALWKTAREQRAARHLLTATVLRPIPDPTPEIDPETAVARDTRRVLARWAAPDGTGRRSGAIRTRGKRSAGDRVRLWTDTAGRPVAPPLDATTARLHGVLAGFGSTVAALAALEGARRLVTRFQRLRRYARLDRAWRRANQDYGWAGTGS